MTHLPHLGHLYPILSQMIIISFNRIRETKHLLKSKSIFKISETRPRNVLARHYTDFLPEVLKRIYDGSCLKVLE